MASLASTKALTTNNATRAVMMLAVARIRLADCDDPTLLPLPFAQEDVGAFKLPDPAAACPGTQARGTHLRLERAF